MSTRMPVTKVPTFGTDARIVADLTERLLGKSPTRAPPTAPQRTGTPSKPAPQKRVF